MNASFEEKSVWIQLVGTVVGLGAYFFVAGRMLAAGVRILPAYAPLFAVSVVLMVIFLVVGHAAVAIASRPEGRDERDRLIGWRAENNSSWLLAAGILFAITGMVFSIDNVWIAHLLLLSLFLSEVLGFILRIVYYRRGM
ncbi:hypothetical protein [Aquisphaera insulae]|uniref:hypothetical protein n=1 Tax=Aquisphaera insulae TaxID=2712864 RepID=UPI0013EB7C12|nr:hypothetical protein [Aquisphaera insulae]